jgi:uncharacterized protein YqeY
MTGPYQQRLTADMKAALKSGQRERLRVLRLMINELKEQQLRGKSDELAEADELAVLQKAVKVRKDAVAQAEELGRADVAASERAEIEIIESYLPAMMTGDELAAAVKALADEIGYAGPKDKGRFMKEWMARYKGRAEGRDVQAALGGLGG